MREFVQASLLAILLVGGAAAEEGTPPGGEVAELRRIVEEQAALIEALRERVERLESKGEVETEAVPERE